MDHTAARTFKLIGNPTDLIEPETFQLVAQCLKQLRHRVPHSTQYEIKKVVVVVTISSRTLIFITNVIKSSLISLHFLRDTYHYTLDTNVL